MTTELFLLTMMAGTIILVLTITKFLKLYEVDQYSNQ